MRTTYLNTISLLVMAALTGCGGMEAPEPAAGTVRGAAPAIGAPGGVDSADSACNIVLRNVYRDAGSNGYLTDCDSGACLYVWKGYVEVADTVKPSDATVHVLYRLKGDSSWWRADATTAQNPQPGYRRYEFRMSQHLFGPDAQGKQPEDKVVELIPYLSPSGGGRVFDHNGVAGKLDNYKLESKTGYQLYPSSVCKPVFGRISFSKNWSEHLSGTLRQGGHLVINYDLERLKKCRGTHNGHPAWDIVAHVKFGPAGQLRQGSVRSLAAPTGTPTNNASSKELVIKIPTTATSAEIWFNNYSGAGSSCSVWDSNYGANYKYEVWPAADNPRCKGVQSWKTQHSDMPYRAAEHCLAYDIDSHHGATHCELAVSGFGQGYMAHYGIPQGWYEAYIKAPSKQYGTLLGAGMWVRYYQPTTGKTGERFIMARTHSPGTWQPGFIHKKTSPYSGSYTRSRPWPSSST